MKKIASKGYLKIAQVASPLHPDDKEAAQFVNEVRRQGHDLLAKNKVAGIEAFTQRVQPSPAIGLGMSISGNVERWVDVSEEFRKNDIRAAAMRVLREATQLSQDPAFSQKRQLWDEVIETDQSRYRSRGGDNWSGD